MGKGSILTYNFASNLTLNTNIFFVTNWNFKCLIHLKLDPTLTDGQTDVKLDCADIMGPPNQ